MMKNALDTLLHTIQNDPLLFGNGKVLFLNAQCHGALDVFDKQNLTLQQYFKPYENDLVTAGFEVNANIPEDNQLYDMVLLLLPKNIVEAKYMIAKGAQLLSPNGMFACAADNKAGGARIKKLMQEFGFDNITQESRNKARVAWGNKGNLNNQVIDTAIKEGKEQNILDGKFISQAGIFGWNKIDTGSEILTGYLPNNLKGVGADFGCGYGYLSEFILSKNADIEALYCIDADHKAIDCCQQNLEHFSCDKNFLWSDLTKQQNDIKNLDFIIMNPPFHDGKNTDMSLGVSFIKTAHSSLSKYGKLYMVANKQLAYEDILAQLFKQSNKLYEGQGFKVFEAINIKPIFI